MHGDWLSALQRLIVQLCVVFCAAPVCGRHYTSTRAGNRFQRTVSFIIGICGTPNKCVTHWLHWLYTEKYFVKNSVSIIHPSYEIGRLLEFCTGSRWLQCECPRAVEYKKSKTQLLLLWCIIPSRRPHCALHLVCLSICQSMCLCLSQKYLLLILAYEL